MPSVFILPHHNVSISTLLPLHRDIAFASGTSSEIRSAQAKHNGNNS
jgi:hypothetical protein